MAYKTPDGTRVTGVFDPVKKAVKKVAKGVVEVASDVIAAPAVIKSNRAIAESGRVADAIKTTREMKGAQDGGDYRDPLFRARATAAIAKPALKKRK